ncbi:MFS transporter [Streptomyces bambusae]|uniref:MFS transporter n=1 Tax=Streptomyces bambusae TaxID=1550616 RepID=UPI001CFFA559|nr:MFS transporter [Streptomyces bambusae]MCB5169496.1 MFS transporter [Streptomyces bambusae]
MRRVLRDRDAGLYFSGVVVSGFGTTAMWLVAGVWVKTLTGSDGLAALTAFALWAPVLAGPVLGAVADRVRRRPLLVAVNGAMAALLPCLLLVGSADRVWLLFAVLLLYGTAGVLADAAGSALVPQVVDARLLGDFNGLRMAAGESMKLPAPLVGAVLFARFGGPSVALLDAATFALAAGVFALLRVREEPAREARSGGLAEGSRQLWRSPVLRPLLAGAAATMLLAGVNGALVYAVVDDVLGRPPAYAGLLYAVQGAGSVVGGLAAGPLLRRLPGRPVLAAAVAVFATGAGLRVLPYEAAAWAGSALIGAGLPVVLVTALTAVQRETPAAVLGRTAATASTLVLAPNALALALGAGLVTLVDVRVLLPVVGAAGLAVAALSAAGRPVRRPGRGVVPGPPGGTAGATGSGREAAGNLAE